MPQRQQTLQEAVGCREVDRGGPEVQESGLNLCVCTHPTMLLPLPRWTSLLCPQSSTVARDNSQSLGSFSSAVKMTAPPGRLGCGKG